MPLKQISSGRPPALWSTIDDAFKAINDNFLELDLRTGGTDADFSNISSTIAPSESGTYTLGTLGKKWKRLYLNSDGLHVGNSVISEISGSLNLPEGTKVNGVLIKNPDDTIFKTISVAGQDSLVADALHDTLNVVADDGIAIETEASTDSLIIRNSGVLSLWSSPTSGISVDQYTGNVTITNTGVTELTTIPGNGIDLSDSNGDIVIRNIGVVSLEVGDAGGLIIENDGTAYTIVNSSPNIVQSVWKNIAVSGQTTLEADTSNSTLNVVGGTGITVTTNALNDSITITATGAVSASALENGSYTVSLGSDGNLLFPGNSNGQFQIAPAQTTDVSSTTPTVIFTGTAYFVDTMKATIQVRDDIGSEAGGIFTYDTQLCEMLIVKQRVYDANIDSTSYTVEAMVYGVTHTSLTPMATFDAQWNTLTNQIEITMVKDAAYTSLNAKVMATESVNLTP